MSVIKPVIAIIKWIFVFLLGYIIFVEVVLRIIRRYFQFPIPGYAARLIDNPIRRRIQSPDTIADWIGILKGMQVLEVGPGPGTFTFAVSRKAGVDGHIYAVDIQEIIIARLIDKIARQGIENVSAEQASAYELPFPDQFFDRIFMITVLGEIPDKMRALAEFRRVMKDDGVLAIGEFLPDPDFPRRKTVIAWCKETGFRLSEQFGNLLHYLLLFRKQEPKLAEQ